MGMNGSDYGSGTPVAAVWRPDVGLAVAHVERVPKLIALPVAAQPDGTRIAIEGDEPIVLAPGELVTLPETFVMAHPGDHFRRWTPIGGSWPNAASPPRRSRSSATRRSGAPGDTSATSPPSRCTARCTRQGCGCEWAVLDDGWQKSVGDWVLDPHKFPHGDAGMKAFADRIKRSACARSCGSRRWRPIPARDLLRDHPDMLLLDADGAAQNVTWWNSFTLCPAYPPTVDYFKGVTSGASWATGASRA